MNSVNICQALIWSFSFSVFYPLGLYDFVYQKKARSLWKCHIMICNMVAGLTVVLYLFCDVPLSVKVMLVIWKGILIFISRKFWKDPLLPRIYLFIPVVTGLGILLRILAAMPGGGLRGIGAKLSIILVASYLIFKGVNRMYLRVITK